MSLLSPLVDQQYVEELGARVRSPKLEELKVWVGDDEKFVLFDRDFPEQLRWENQHKVNWHVQYSLQCSDLKISENGRADRERMLMALGAIVEIYQSPPQDWNEYIAWVDELGVSIQDYIGKIMRERRLEVERSLD